MENTVYTAFSFLASVVIVALRMPMAIMRLIAKLVYVGASKAMYQMHLAKYRKNKRAYARN